MKRFDSEGEPIRGKRSVNTAQAEIVRCVFREYGHGVSPQTIARRLNDEGVPGRKISFGRTARCAGMRKCGTGILNNELYIGRLVRKGQRYVKDPRSGRRVSRINTESEWIIADVPELRIVNDALWQAAKAWQEQILVQYAGTIEAVRRSVSMRSTVRPKSLPSGLLQCGVCGGPYSLRGQGRFACSAPIDTRNCDDSRTIARAVSEERVLSGLRDRLTAAEAIEVALRACIEETNQLNWRRRDAVRGEHRTGYHREEQEGHRHCDRERRYSETLMNRLLDFEAREKVLTQRMSERPADVPDVHPCIAELCARKVARLTGPEPSGGPKRSFGRHPEPYRTRGAHARRSARRDPCDSAGRVWRYHRMGSSARSEERPKRQRRP